MPTGDVDRPGFFHNPWIMPGFGFVTGFAATGYFGQDLFSADVLLEAILHGPTSNASSQPSIRAVHPALDARLGTAIRAAGTVPSATAT
jgi:hypothetical protein